MKIFAKPRRGLSLIEVVIALAATTLIMAFVAYVMVAAARNMQVMTNEAESEKDAHLAMDQIRFYLLMARFESTVFKDADHTIEFVDPNLGNITSALKFSNGTLWYDRDVTDMRSPEKRADRLLDVTFTNVENASMIRVNIRARGRRGDLLINPLEVTNDIYLRNY